MIDHRFPTMGGQARVVLDGLAASKLAALADDVHALCDEVDATLSRFRPDSALSRFNRGEPVASQWLRRLAGAACWAGMTSGGLVDATRLGELRAADAPRADLAEALAAAPARSPARPHHARAYARTGSPLDSGGLAKGMAADLAASHLPSAVHYAISVGGDVAVRGRWQLQVEPAFADAEPVPLVVDGGGVATSGIGARLWRRADGTYAHHLLDPSTGEPAWTGLGAVTAVAGAALAAEVLAKQALLSGPRAARRLLRGRGGVLQHEDATLELVEAAPVVRLKVPA